MSLGPHLISIPCTLIPVQSFISHAKFPQYPSFTIHESYHTYLASHCAYIRTYERVSHHNNHIQTNSNHPRAIKQPNSTLSRPAPRSGGTPSPRRGLEEGTRSQRGISLRRVPSRLGEMFARSKVEQVAWATFRAKRVWASPCLSRLGETGSFGRVYQVSPLFSCNSHSHQLNPTNPCVHS